MPNLIMTFLPYENSLILQVKPMLVTLNNKKRYLAFPSKSKTTFQTLNTCLLQISILYDVI